MHSLYQILSGPLLWLTFILFVGGSLYRLGQLFLLVRKKERFMLSYWNLNHSLRSLLRWSTPFATTSMRLNPVMTAVTFTFHISLLLVPLFLSSHIVLWEESWNVQWWALPEGVAEIMSLAVVAASVFFLVRRLIRKEVRYLTSASDFVLLAIVAAPFVTGLYCLYQWPGYAIANLVHIFSGEVMLVAIPFTRLSHMFLAVFSRTYTGSEFGAVRHARDW